METSFANTYQKLVVVNKKSHEPKWVEQGDNPALKKYWDEQKKKW